MKTAWMWLAWWLVPAVVWAQPIELGGDRAEGDPPAAATGLTHAFGAVRLASLAASVPDNGRTRLDRQAALNPTVLCAADSGGQHDRLGEDQRVDFDRTVCRLRELGLLITADPQKIDQVTSEAAYFMYAQRKDHQPRTEPWKAPEKKHWLDGKPVLADGADKAVLYPLFSRLVEQAGYDTVWIYQASVHYGVSNWARFSLYKLGYRDADQHACRCPPVLLGDGDYVLRLP